ncbi:MAG TPA: N-acetylglucosamine-6-phosphate deacetylase, partial [Planctomycetaceae bacterium]|nr:N-acetylglucosamine-6-phosphate deacetylase [Planctomycetaceae bacterium]
MEVIARRYDTGRLAKIITNDVRIESVVDVNSAAVTDHSSVMAADVSWVSPGFVDLQINGYGGQEFNDLELDSERLARLCLAMDADGVTQFLPTLTTQSFEMLSHGMRAISTACQQDPRVQQRVAGIHLEGPYLCDEDGPRGAHPKEHCRPPDWDEFQRLQEAAGGNIRLLTISPEFESAPPVIRNVVNSGVVVAIGHTSADSAQIQAAVDAGASMSTHLGNGAHRQLRRHPNYIWDQLAEDRLIASLIVDGHHLPAEVVKAFVRCKTVERCILVSDITGMAGMPPGLHENASLGQVEILEDGRLVVPGQRQLLAGASLPIGVGIANVMRFADVDLASAIGMAS